MANIIELNPPLRKPIVYCAGRMGASPDDNDWRNCISAWRMLCEQSWSQYPDRDQIADCGAFWYGGPFGYDSHGNTRGYAEWPDGYFNLYQIRRADLFIAYCANRRTLNTPTELVEIGYAAALGKPIALGFNPTLPHDYVELWLTRMPAARVYHDTPQRLWNQVSNEWIA
jgi:hypothetical protein